MIATYITLSPIGLVETDKPRTIDYELVVMGIAIAIGVLGIPIMRRRVASKNS